MSQPIEVVDTEINNYAKGLELIKGGEYDEIVSFLNYLREHEWYRVADKLEGDWTDDKKLTDEKIESDMADLNFLQYGA